MKRYKILTFFLVLRSFISFGQDYKYVETSEETINTIKQNTRGLNFILSDTKVNTELNEIGTTFFKNKFIILSNKKRRFADITINPTTKIPNNNLYCVDIKEDRTFSFPVLFSQALDSENEEGFISFSPDQKTVFYTKENPNNRGLFQLYKATLNEDDPDKWINITLLDLVSDQYSIETPFVSADGNKIYIATNIPGGYGGFDIYEANISEDGSIGTLINLGPNINTTADEKFPYLTSDNKYLYFSSKGHLNLGGYDVFKAANVKNLYTPAINLGTELNSSKDDISFILSSPYLGYISSDKNQSGNFDIYKFEIKKQDNLFSNYTIVEEFNQVVIPDAKVILTDEFGTKVAETNSDSNGIIKLKLEPLTIYKIEVSKDGFETKLQNIAIGDVNNKISLTNKEAIVLEDVIAIENIYFDFDKSTIRKESETSLNKIIEILEKNISMNISINAHTDNKGSFKYNQKLSDSRAKSTFKYLIKKGIPKNRLSYKGFGESELLEKCAKCSAEQDQRNRRVEFKIVK